MKIFLSSGHNPTKPGACNNGTCEYSLASEWNDIIKKRLEDFFYDVVIVPTGSLKEKVRFINENCGPDDIAIELHFNSNVNAVGSETLYYPNSSNGKKFAETMQKNISKIFYPDRGIKEGYHSGSNKLLYFLAKTKPVSIIIEPEFIYHLDKIKQNKIAGCEAIVYSIREYLRIR